MLQRVNYGIVVVAYVGMMLLAPVAALITAPLFFLSAVVPLFLCCSRKVAFPYYTSRAFIVGVLFLGWCFVSGFWSINSAKTWDYAFKLTAVFIAFWALYAVLQDMSVSYIRRLRTIIGIAWGVGLLIWSVVLFSDGQLVMWVKQLLGSSESVFKRDMLNRGTVYVVACFWVVFASAIPSITRGWHWCLWAVIACYILAMCIIYTESLASVLALLVGMGVFILSLLCGRYVGGIMLVAIVIGAALLMAVLAIYDAPQLLAYTEMLPASAQHRLVIWDFVMSNAMEKPWLGWGYHVSRYMPITEQDWIQGFHPLPLHPHNVILQVFLELGGVGLVFALAGLVGLVYSLGDLSLVPAARAAAYAWYGTVVTVACVGYGAWQMWWLCLVLGLYLLLLCGTKRLGG